MVTSIFVLITGVAVVLCLLACAAVERAVSFRLSHANIVIGVAAP